MLAFCPTMAVSYLLRSASASADLREPEKKDRTLKRVVIPELLDTDAGTPREVADSLADLRFVNRAFGGASTSLSLIRRAARHTDQTNLSYLEVAAGSGDIPLFVQRKLKAQGITLDLTLLDRNASHLPTQATTVVGDALALPFSDNTFDFAACSLFIHHLEPPAVFAFAREALRVVRHGLLINDLIRHPLHLALVYAGMPLYRSRLTRHDAPASVRRAYTPRELNTLLGNAGASRIELSHHYLFRMGVILWK